MQTTTRLLIGMLLSAGLGTAWAAERFELESAIIDSTTARPLGGSKESGELANFFNIQKKMLYAALKDLGIPLESLPPDIRNKLAQFHTTNFDAFKQFSLGLNAQDEGKFAEAKAFFERAVELDPNFQLAGELGFSMPNTNVSGSVQLQAVLSSAAQAATSSGKVQVEVDLSAAIVAMQSGQTIVVGNKSDASSTAQAASAGSDFTSNPPGSATAYADRKVIGIQYSVQLTPENQVSVAATNEWTLDQVSLDQAGLVSVGDSQIFQARRGNASDTQVNTLNLGDGSAVSWGRWQASPSGSFSVTTEGNAVANLGPQFQYMIGQATREMPTSGSATFVPKGGFLNDVSGNISVNFVDQSVKLNNLGFSTEGRVFSGLQGDTMYRSSIGSGFFKGNYTAGTCSGCQAFSPEASLFGGNFLGKNADGLMFSTLMQTGNGTASGVHVFGK